MAQAAATENAAERLLKLAGRLETIDGFAEVLASLKAGHGATFDGVRGSGSALLAAALAAHSPGPLVIVLAHAAELDDLGDDLRLFTSDSVEAFPAWESLPTERLVRDEIFGERLRLLKRLARGDAPRIIATSIASLLQPVPPRDRLLAHTRSLRRGDRLVIDDLLRWLAENGFESTSAVELPGEFSLRGGILDLFAPDWDEPVRVELFDDEIESIRRFDIASQRSLAAVETVDVTVLAPGEADRDHFTSYLPKKSWFLLVEPWEIEEEGRHYLERLDRPESYHGVSQALAEIYRFPSATAASLSTSSLETTCHLRTESVERFSGDIHKVRAELETVGEGHEVHLVCQNEAEVHRLDEIFGDTRLARAGRLHLTIGRLRAGFRLGTERVILVSGNELFHRTDLARRASRRLGRVIDSFLELREGDHVVHLAHGIGRYRGMKLLEKSGQTEEHLELEFDEGTKIFVPASKIELVQKYVGGSKSRPKLAKIGGRSWIRQKEAAERAVVDMASDMLDLQAARAARPGIAFPDDSDWQREFEAAFPYTETPDQLTGISAIKRDMTAMRPMDRLVCGDVGYGKTELAMRAAFRSVDAGYQVAVLVPTTLLADQHGRTFKSRMVEYPFQIAVLSRFCTDREQRQIIEGLADGSIDLVIGTHRLAQHDVQFHNLGLLVIDEEQRFGVAVKERLKALRQTVDVLTMTATPIPRTLHMSLLGLRDISNLETPPPDRLAIETRVTRFDPELVRHAVLRELNRGGQIYFVHNRIKDIDRVAWQLQQVVPEVRIGIGHGQMGEGDLEQVMVDFVAHRFDLLLATTIVESGLDIPNANTMFIDEADRYGLADLHQLRGRVGRYKHRAYCYMLLDPRRSITSTAAKRLAAIEEFSSMGAGFAIAMRDLEIRGAGNILGTEQSGHIAAVGYELYCQLLEQAVRRLRNMAPRLKVDVNVDLPGEAFIPRRYIPDMRLKIDVYRRLARVTSPGELSELAAELTDRFGPIPRELDRMFARMEIRLAAVAWSIDSIHLEDGFAVFTYRARNKIEKLAKIHPKRVRIVDQQTVYVPLARGLDNPDSIAAVIKSLLQPK